MRFNRPSTLFLSSSAIANLRLDRFVVLRFPSAEPFGTRSRFAGRAPATGRTAARTALIAAKSIAALAAFALWAAPIDAAELSDEDAAHHVGETATVCGIVASGKFDANLQSQPTFLDFGKRYPDQVFTAVIFGGDRTKFGMPETALRGKRICVTGKIQENRGIPEIILSDPKQLGQ